MNSEFQGAVDADFSRARLKAFFADVAAILSRRPNALLTFDEVRDKLHIRQQIYRGVRAVPVAKIVGTVNRYADFDRHFLPTQSHTQDRWKSIDRAHYQAVNLPPVVLYQIGDAYFVRDGHHRVSVARQQGVEFIDAEVIECQARVPIAPDLRPDDLIIKGEYTDFLERTGLDRLRPDQHVEFSIPGNYQALLKHIAVHHYFLGLERDAEVSWEEAVCSWYDNLYLPIVEAIRAQNVLAEFPGRTEADLYLWIMDHRHYLSERYGEAVEPEEAAADFAAHFSQRLVKRVIREVRGKGKGNGQRVNKSTEE